MKRGLLSVVTDLKVPAVRSAGFQAPSSGSAEAMASLAASQQNIAAHLAGVARKIGDAADEAAVKEGAAAGRLAGMDPEFRTKDNGTLRGEAFDKAALETYGSKVRVEVENDILSGGDLAKKRDAWLTRVPKELQPDVDYAFRRGQLAKDRKDTRDRFEQTQAEAAASLQSELDTSIKSLHQRAFQMGLDGTADAVIGRDVAMIERALKRADAEGKPLVTPQQAEKMLSAARENASTARLMGAFSRLPGLDAKEQFITRLRDDFANSRGLAKDYDLDGFNSVTGQLESDYRSARAEQRASVAMAKDRVSSTVKLLEKGYPVPPDEMAAVRAGLAGLGSSGAEISAEVETAERLMNFQVWARKQSPAELEAVTGALRDKVGADGADPATVKTLEVGEKLLDEARREIKQDPLGWSDRTQFLAVPPVSMESPEVLAQSMADRVARAETIAAHYGQQPKYLRPDEAQALATAAAEGGPKGAAILSAIGQAGGDKALKIFEQVGDTAPQVAWLGGLATLPGSQGIVREALDGIAFRKSDPKVKLRAPPIADVKAAAVDVLGDVFNGRPDDEQTVLQLANAVYETRAQRQGLVNFDPDTWKQGLREVLGESKINGEMYGGMADSAPWYSSKSTVLIPPEVKKSEFRDVVGMIDTGDLDRAGISRPVGANGKPVPLSRVHGGKLVQISPYEFAVALGDPNTPGGEQWVMGADGQGFVLDFRRLIPHLRRRNPEAFR